MKIAVITAGGAGMFCGSCMQDNSLVRALRSAGADALLIPTYTPIRVDEDNLSSGRVFMGGINVYLDSRVPGWRHLPGFLKRWLDRPSVVQFLSRMSSSTAASELGGLTCDLLSGTAGPQQRSIRELVDWLVDELQPDLVLFSNALLSGAVPELRRRWKGPIGCLLQGDDIFLEGLVEPWKSRAMQMVRTNCAEFHFFLTHSRYYADFMCGYLQLDSARIRTIPLTVDDAPTIPADDSVAATHRGELRIGYFARICPEKGAFRFLNAAERVLPQRPDITMVMAGFLPKLHEMEFRKRTQALAARYPTQFFACGSPDGRIEKFRLIQSFDWLCVPTEYREPKGLYVLEAALVGVPSLLPDHGAFPERIEMLRAGRLFEALSDDSLVKALLQLTPMSPDIERDQLRKRCLDHCLPLATGTQIFQILKREVTV